MVAVASGGTTIGHRGADVPAEAFAMIFGTP